MKKIILSLIISALTLLVSCSQTELDSSMQKYIDIVDNTLLIDDLITTKVKDNLFNEHFGSSFDINGVNAKAEIECLRKFNNSYYYSIHLTESNVYYIYFYRNVEGILKCEFVHKYSTYVDSDMLNIIENETTFYQLKEKYPIFQYISFSSHSALDFGYIYYSDGSVYVVYLDMVADVYSVVDYKLYISPMSNIYYNMLLDIDKNVIFDYDDI